MFDDDDGSDGWGLIFFIYSGVGLHPIFVSRICECSWHQQQLGL